MAFLVLRSVGLCFGQNQMCHLCGWLKLFLKNVRWEKIKIQKRWLLGRLSVGSFVLSLCHVYFCRSFLLCRLLGLQVTCRAFAKPGTFFRNASANPNVKQNRNLSNVLRNPGFANALLWAGFYLFLSLFRILSIFSLPLPTASSICSDVGINSKVFSLSQVLIFSESRSLINFAKSEASF